MGIEEERRIDRWMGSVDEKLRILSQTVESERTGAANHRHDIRNKLHEQDGVLAELTRDVGEMKPIVKRVSGWLPVLAVAGAAGAVLFSKLADRLLAFLPI